MWSRTRDSGCGTDRQLSVSSVFKSRRQKRATTHTEVHSNLLQYGDAGDFIGGNVVRAIYELDGSRDSQDV
jgi:hypothetical protein